MSVCSQMGNGHTKGGKKKKKDLLKEVTCHDDDPTSFQQELENGDLNKTLEVEGSRQFLEEKSRRRDLLKDLGKLKIKSQEPPENAAGINPCSSGAPSSDCGVSQVNAGTQSDGRHIDDNNSLPQKAVQDDLTCKVQDGNDSNGPFDDQGHDLVDSPHPRSESDRVPDDVPTGGPGQVDDEPSDASESVHHGVPNNVPPGLALIHDALEGNSNGATVGATSSSPGLSPNRGLEGHCDGANVDAASSSPGQINAGLTPDPLQASVTNPAQQKMGNAETTRSGKALPQEQGYQEQNEYVLDTTSNQSIPPTPQSKTEFSTPPAMQIVPGLTQRMFTKDSDAEKLKGEFCCQ